LTRSSVLLLVACSGTACAAEEDLGPGVADPRTMADVRDGPGGSQVLYLVASSARGVGSGPLAAGVAYRVTIEGTVSLWRREHWASLCGGTPMARPEFPSRGVSGPVGVDAEWVWAWPGDSPSLCLDGAPIGPPPRPRRLVLVQVAGAPFQPLPPAEEPGMTPDHAYTYVVRGTGAPVVFLVDDSPREDNYGVLRIGIAPNDPAQHPM
jgi:hypothetical protein